MTHPTRTKRDATQTETAAFIASLLSAQDHSHQRERPPWRLRLEPHRVEHLERGLHPVSRPHSHPQHPRPAGRVRAAPFRGLPSRRISTVPVVIAQSD